MRWLIALIFSTSVYASISLDFGYLQSADIFEILDNMTMWSPNNIKAYREYWVNSVGLSHKDKNLIDKYVEIRRKYAKTFKPENENLLFSPSIGSTDIPIDAISDAFYSSKTVDDAIKVLQKRLTLEEVKFFVVFYKHFKESLLSILKESSLLDNYAKKMNENYVKGKFDNIFKKSESFLDLDKKIRIKLSARVVWYPPEAGYLISHVGTTTLIRINPIVHADKVDFLNISTSLMQRVSSFQQPLQKEGLSKQFMESCSYKSEKDIRLILEKPIALIFGKIFLEEKLKKKEFSLYQRWDVDSWANMMSVYLYTSVTRSLKDKKTIADDFMKDAIYACQSLLEFHKN